MLPNASLLSLLSIPADNAEYIFFAYLKELTELAPESGPFWYDKKGAKNKADFLWPEKKIKQWLVIGEDITIHSIFRQLTEQGTYTKSLAEYKDIQFLLNPTVLQQGKDDVMQVDELPFFNQSRRPQFFQQPNLDSAVPFLLGENNNCNFLSGYVHNVTIKPMLPAGLLAENFLHDKILDRINAVRQYRDVYCDFSEKTDPVSGNKTLKGFVQMDTAFKRNHSVEARNSQGNMLIGISDIDENKGTWEILLDNKEGKGQIIIKDKLSGTGKYGQRYVILKHLNLATYISDTVITEVFGREIIMSGEETAVPQATDEHWDMSAASDETQAAIELSDKILKVLLTLGKQIRISDPYFLGPLIEKDGKITVPNTSQQVFLNALLVAIGKSGVTSLIIQGFHKNTGKHDEVDTIEINGQYKLLWRLIKETYKGSAHLKISKLELAKTKNIFHDRYWLSDDPAIHTIYHSSNSINGPYENKEWNIQTLEQIAGLKKKATIYSRYDDAEIIDLMK